MAGGDGRAHWLCDAACTYKALGGQEIESLVDNFPGLQVLSLAVTTGKDAQIVQVSFPISLKGACVARTQVYRSETITLAGAVVARGARYTGPLR